MLSVRASATKVDATGKPRVPLLVQAPSKQPDQENKQRRGLAV
ncbi:MAG: hypothetical protein QOJ88_1779 [Pyrinomonadaceae bacterium]|jgi:hypothetical protein|nr:hypothetical protein [Pyrinomonadaceae bacterium]